MNDDMNIGTLLAEQLERLFSEKVNRELFIAVEQGNPATALWQELEALGLCNALVSEEAGGAGLSWEDTEPTLKALGRHGAPLPLAETLLAHWALANAGLEAPSGAIAVSTALWQLNGENQLSGSDNELAWLPVCEHFVAIAEHNGERFVCLITKPQGDNTAIATIARNPTAALQLNNHPVTACAPTALDALGLLPYLASIRACQMGGALEQLLELSVEYGNTREQFGRPIGKFQAIQHALAQLAAQTAAAQVAGLYACRQIDAGNAPRGAMVAKTRAGQAAGKGAEIAHQVFGAIGFTDEHSLHYLTRRLWQWRSDAGSELWWAELLGNAAIADGGDKLWAAITR